jgi:hypothetical protein
MNARFGNMMATIYYTLVNLLATLGSLVLLIVAHWIFKWATVSVLTLVLLVRLTDYVAPQCPDCCCNSCNRGSSYCAFPRFHGEDIGDETRNFVFYMGLVSILNFMLSYSLWANYGSPR